jgi:hypothetical protein
VEQVLPQELMYLVVITRLSTTLLKMLDPVDTCILNFWRKKLLNSAAFYVICESAGTVQATYVSLESYGHKPHASVG